jgi:hypothetical protein
MIYKNLLTFGLGYNHNPKSGRGWFKDRVTQKRGRGAFYRALKRRGGLFYRYE